MRSYLNYFVGSPHLGFKALAEQRRQQWILKQKVNIE